MGRAFRSLLLHFLLLVAPTGVIGIGTHAVAVGRLTLEFSARSETALEASVRQIDGALQAAQELAAHVFSEDLVVRNLAPWSSLSIEQKANLIRLPEALARVRSAAVALVHSLFLYVDSERVYTAAGVEEFDDFFGKFYRYDRYTAEHWRRQLALPHGLVLLAPSPVRGMTGAPCVLVVPMVVSQPIAGARAVMVLNISLEAVERVLRSRALSGATEFAVAGGDGAPFPGAERAAGLAQAAASGAARATIGGRPHVVQSARSLVTGWLYCSATPTAELRRQTGGILRATALASVALTITSVLLSFVFAYRLYSPVRAISDSLLVHAGEAARGRRRPDEYRIIQEGVARLEQRWAALASERARVSLWHLLRNESSHDPPAAAQALADSGMPHPLFVVAAFFPARGSAGSSAGGAFPRELGQSVEAALRPAGAACLLDSQRDYRIAVVNAERPQGRQRLLEAAGAIAAESSLVVGVGRLVSGAEALWRSLSEAITAVRLREQAGGAAVVDAACLPISEQAHYPFEVENRILNLLRAARIASLEHELHGVVRENLAGNASHEAMLRLLAALAATAVRHAGDLAAQPSGRPLRAELPERTPAAMDPMDTDYAAHLDRIVAFYAWVVSASLRLSAEASDSTVGRIMQHIQGHYPEAGLYLESIARHMGLSSKYVSRLFAEKTGVHITDYVEGVRIAKARELLDRTTLKVAEVGRAVGIPDRTTFARVFRKREGVSPRQYRRRG